MAAVGWEPSALHYSHFCQSWPTVEGSAVNHILDHTSWLMFEKPHKNIQHRKKKSEKQREESVVPVGRGELEPLWWTLRRSRSCPRRRGRRGQREISSVCWGCGGGASREASENCGRKGSFRAVTLMPRTMKAEGPEEGISRKAAFAVAQIANRYRI